MILYVHFLSNVILCLLPFSVYRILCILSLFNIICNKPPADVWTLVYFFWFVHIFPTEVMTLYSRDRRNVFFIHKSLYHLRTLIDGQLVLVCGAHILISAHNSGTTCLRLHVPSQKMILSPWPIIPIILSVRSCYTLYIQLRTSMGLHGLLVSLPD